jgi:chemotaxis protein MotA
MRPISIGFTGTLACLALALVLAATVAGLLDAASLLFTLGGALAVTWVTFSTSALRSAVRHLSEAIAPRPGLGDAADLIPLFKRLARVQRADGAPALERATAEVADPFVRRAVALAADTGDRDELEDALMAEARRHVAEGETGRQVLLTLAKLCPAFGLMGTLLGLVLLLHGLADSDVTSMGSALGLAVQTTLYGVILSNVVVVPLATKLQAHLVQRALMLQMIVEGTLLLHREEHPLRVERALRAYVTEDAGEPHGELHLVPRAA